MSNLQSALAVLAFLFVADNVGGSPAAPPLTVQSLTRNPAIWSAQISPNGRYVAAVQETPRGEELIVIDWRTGEAHSTQLARRDLSLHIDWVSWKSDNRLVFLLRQRVNQMSGGQNYPYDTTRVFAADRDGGHATLMFQGEIRNRLADASLPVHVVDILNSDPTHVLLGGYAQHGYTVYRVNIDTGHTDQVIDYADFDTVDMFVDGQGYPVLRVDALTDASGWQFYRRAPQQRTWTLASQVRRDTIAQNRDFQPLGPGPGAGQVYVAARPPGREFQAIYLYNTATGELGAPVFQNDHADAGYAWIDAVTRQVIVGCAEIQRVECRASDPEAQRHLDSLQSHFGADSDIALHGASGDGSLWLISASSPAAPQAYFVYELATGHVTPIASTEPQLPAGALRPVQIVSYSGRDGAPLWGYLTTPDGAGPHPLVVFPHGGPESRDSYGYDFFVQFLAWRGYAVFQPNFRGSEGSGRSFAQAGHRQWGRRMQDDITDGVQHLVQSGVADPARMCIVGASYGGYAALAGAALTPDLYKCAVSIAGVADLTSMLAHERHEAGGHDSAGYAYWVELIGDPDTDREALTAVSPAQQAASVHIPILLVHGEDDRVVPIEQSEEMRDALTRAGKSVEFIRIEHEGHVWSDWTLADRQHLLEAIDTFLGQHIGASEQSR